MSKVEYISDRLGHDKRYALDTSKIQKELEWISKSDFRESLKKVIIS
jgi:dTDP-glucose 4,6-dehydratase